MGDPFVQSHDSLSYFGLRMVDMTTNAGDEANDRFVECRTLHGRSANTADLGERQEELHHITLPGRLH